MKNLLHALLFKSCSNRRSVVRLSTHKLELGLKGIVSENLWSPHFLQPWRLIGDERACLNLSGVVMRDSYPSTTMRVAPDDPKNGSSLKGLVFRAGFSSGRYVVYVIKFQRRKTS